MGDEFDSGDPLGNDGGGYYDNPTPYYGPGNAGGDTVDYGDGGYRYEDSIVVTGDPVRDSSPEGLDLGFLFGSASDVHAHDVYGPPDPYYRPGGAGGNRPSAQQKPGFFASLWSGVKKFFSAVGSFLSKLFSSAAQGAARGLSGGPGGGAGGGGSAKPKAATKPGRIPTGNGVVVGAPGGGISSTAMIVGILAVLGIGAFLILRKG